MTNSEKKSIGRTILDWILMFAGILTACTVISGAGAWMFQDKAESWVVEIFNREFNKREQFISTMAEKMSKGGEEVKPEDVCWKLAKMFREFNTKTEFENDLLDYWIPHLEYETEWLHVGYFVNMEDPSLVKFRHWDGRDYDAWQDEQGWFYVKNGFKFYH